MGRVYDANSVITRGLPLLHVVSVLNGFYCYVELINTPFHFESESDYLSARARGGGVLSLKPAALQSRAHTLNHQTIAETFPLASDYMQIIATS